MPPSAPARTTAARQAKILVHSTRKSLFSALSEETENSSKQVFLTTTRSQTGIHVDQNPNILDAASDAALANQPNADSLSTDATERMPLVSEEIRPGLDWNGVEHANFFVSRATEYSMDATTGSSEGESGVSAQESEVRPNNRRRDGKPSGGRSEGRAVERNGRSNPWLTYLQSALESVALGVRDMGAGEHGGN